ncbi:MAG: hypothetical protein ABJE95_22815 [Byssovorax sp.]
MATAFYLLIIAGTLGAFDVVYFHIHISRLAQRPECQREVLWHTIRHAVYATQFLWVANLRFHGAALLFVAALYGLDVFIAWSDVLEETASRKAQGGLPRGEYFMHVVLSLLVGAYLLQVAQTVWPDRLLPTAIVLDPPPVPFILRAMMTFMGLTAIGVFLHDLRAWLRFRARPAPSQAEA